MRSLAVLAICAACGGRPAHPRAAAPAAPAFPAARWIPAHPTYVLASPSLRDAQRAVRDAADVLGTALGGNATDLSRALEDMLGVDPLDPGAVEAAGIDLAGAALVFSDALDPTIVVHLASPDALAAFFERQRERGLVTHSVIVDGDEVFTARVAGAIDVSWVVDRDWLWVHFGMADDRASTAWFQQAHHPAPAAWATNWTWAERLASRAAGVHGFVALHALVADLAQRAPEAIACARLLQPIERVSVTIGATDHGARLQLGFGLGAAARGVGAALLPPPPGWDAAAHGAPIAAAWNLDLVAATRWLAPCVGVAQHLVAEQGVRAARVMVRAFDPDDLLHARGAVALDLAPGAQGAGSLAHDLLDKIPMRAQLERERAFGAYHGHRISVPLGPTVDYVLDEHVALAALGDGLLDAIASPPGPGPAPHAALPAAALPAAAPSTVFALDLAPPGLSQSAWTWLFSQLGDDQPDRAAERLLRWRDLHVGARLDGDLLVIEAAGDRR